MATSTCILTNSCHVWTAFQPLLTPWSGLLPLAMFVLFMVNIFMAFSVGAARRRYGITYPSLYAVPNTLRSYGGDETKPVSSSSSLSELCSPEDAAAFNRVQRGHQNVRCPPPPAGSAAAPGSSPAHPPSFLAPALLPPAFLPPKTLPAEHRELPADPRAEPHLVGLPHRIGLCAALVVPGAHFLLHRLRHRGGEAQQPHRRAADVPRAADAVWPEPLHGRAPFPRHAALHVRVKRPRNGSARALVVL